MDERLAHAIRTRTRQRDLTRLEDNIRKRGLLTPEVVAALDGRSGELARTVVAERTGLDLSNLTPAEEKIVRATATYLGIKIRGGTNANRTLLQIKHLGLIGAAEAAVSRSTTTLGFQTLSDAELPELSYEQIVLDHTEEFSDRAIWYARRTLGLPNSSPKPPSSAVSQEHLQKAKRVPLTGSRPPVSGPYWVFVCNPKKWAIDRFLESNIEHDFWGVRPSDVDAFAPGQLGIVRVGVDRRSVDERNGAPLLQPGIYALCEVESEAFPGTGATGDFWAEDAAREPGWPTVKIRYLKTYAHKPLTVERLRAEAPRLSPLLLNGFQAASFPLTASDFHQVIEFLGECLDEIPTAGIERPEDLEGIARLEERYLRASPEVQDRISRVIERGPVGAWAKRISGHRCQVCAALGCEAVGFSKRNGEPYVEAHHVMPVSRREVGSLALSNVITVCANHHRQLHYGEVTVAIGERQFEIELDGRRLAVERLRKAAG
ncbi:EVE domain-containing protein [Plastoroseomonas hellenica]|uniref:EVE domain-containing protein n=1 Tax=Plastoroseomonas hellenica TaxID=2687306 RepID=UPI001BAB35B3|nr:EVE domain-containing protein [Plastoroseomonas hellenica]MBR0642920.1 HNH endonuclease [Plastoroseomonas hellenica]